MKFFSQRLDARRRGAMLRRVSRVMAHEQFIGGPEVAELERALSDRFGMAAITCNSGTDALSIGLRSLGIGPGDEVISTAFTYFATIEAIASVGARPVLVDIDPETFNIDASAIEARITPRTRAVLVVHLFGLACNILPVAKLCRKRKLFLIEDCAQSFGARGADGRLTGAYGDLGCFSFFPTKNLGGLGDGGAVTLRSKNAAYRFKLYKNHGQPKKYVHDVLGFNSRIDTLQAAFLLEKMKWLEDDLALRRTLAEKWIRRFRRDERVLALPTQEGHTYNVFTMRVRGREAFAAELAARGIPTAVYYDRPVYRQRAYVRLFGTHAPLPQAERACAEVLSLPIH